MFRHTQRHMLRHIVLLCHGLQNCKLGHGRRLRCAFASPNPSAVVANSCTHRRRWRDETRQFRLVGGVYWALDMCSVLLQPLTLLLLLLLRYGNYLGMQVWNLVLVGMRPLLSSWMPTESSPRPSVYGRRPIHTRSTSQSSCQQRTDSKLDPCAAAEFFCG